MNRKAAVVCLALVIAAAMLPFTWHQVDDAPFTKSHYIVTSTDRGVDHASWTAIGVLLLGAVAAGAMATRSGAELVNRRAPYSRQRLLAIASLTASAGVGVAAMLSAVVLHLLAVDEKVFWPAHVFWVATLVASILSLLLVIEPRQRRTSDHRDVLRARVDDTTACVRPTACAAPRAPRAPR